MTRGQRVLGFIWLPVHMVLLPLVLGAVLILVLGKMPSEANLNAIYYAISFLFILIAFWGFLKEGFRRFTERLGYCFLVMFIAYVMQMGLSLVLTLLSSFFGELATPNNDAVAALAGQDFKKMFAVAVLMAPIAEECLFRGVIFGSIARKNRVIAYVVTILVFSLYHVWQFAVLEKDWTVLINAVEYFPLTSALTYCYDRTETIWTPIFFHMLINTMALMYMVSL